MPFFKWQAALDTGISEIDEQHHRLLDMINELHDAMSSGKGKEAVSKLVGDMIEYTDVHFTLEEKYMKEFDFPGLDDHKVKHIGFVDKVSQFKQDLDQDKQVLSTEVMHFLKEWLFTHIARSDQEYISLFKEKGL